MLLDNIFIILVEPQGPQNIGSTCRAMKAMGFENLIIVRPKSINIKEIKIMACGSEDIFYKAPIYDSIKEAIKDLDWIVGMTGRKRHHQTLIPLNQVSGEIIEHCQNQKVGILFGREDWGLSNAHLDLCQTHCIIPTSNFHSINLSQSVIIACHDIRSHIEKPCEVIQDWANQKDIQKMLDDWKNLLSQVDYMNRGTPETLMRALKQMGDRAGLRKREVRILHGIANYFKKFINQISAKNK